MMRPENLQHRITFQQRDTSKNPSNGEEIVAWEDVCTVWAEYAPVRGRELFAARQVQAETVGSFRIRFREGLLPEMRVSFKGKVFDIDSIVPFRGQARWLEIYVREGLTNG